MSDDRAALDELDRRRADLEVCLHLEGGAGGLGVTAVLEIPAR